MLTDFTEIENLTQRRAKEFGRGRDFTQSFRYVVPEFHVALEKEDPRYSANKDLLKDTMTPTFLQNVSWKSSSQFTNVLKTVKGVFSTDLYAIYQSS